METSTIQEKDLTLHERVAFGATCEVYRASWISRNGEELEVAAKKIPIRSDTELQEQLNIEVNILSRMNHRNVIKYYGHAVTPTHVIIVTEFAARGSLYDYLKKQKGLPLKLLHKWAVEAARGIQHLKNLQIVHRDIKSPNFLITSDYTLKVCDFGISKDAEVTQSTQSKKGTMSWLAPEVYMEGKLSPKADVYSFGIVLWELCTCQKPFKGMNEHHLMYKVSTEQHRLEIPVNCPSQLKSLIEECWQQDRKKRPGIDEVVSRLERFAEIDEQEVVLHVYEDDDVAKIAADATPTDAPDGPVPGRTNIKREEQEPTPMDTSTGVDMTGYGVHPNLTDVSTNDFGPIQESGSPPGSLSSTDAGGASASGGAGDQQTAGDDPWNIVADLHINKIQKRDINRKVLNSMTEIMCNLLHADPILHILKTRHVLDDGDVADIRSQVRTDAKVDRLLEIIKRKSDEAYVTFMEVLKNHDLDLYNKLREIERNTIVEWREFFLRQQKVQLGAYVAPAPGNYQAYMQPPPKAPYRPYEDVTKITDQDFMDVIQPMTPDQLFKLFLNLGLKSAAIEKAKLSANSNDVELQALAVFQRWRQLNGRAATREVVLKALEKAGNLEVKSGLQRQWNLSV